MTAEFLFSIFTEFCMITSFAEKLGQLVSHRQMQNTKDVVASYSIFQL